MDLSDERFHRRRIPWKRLENDGYSVKEVMLAAQKQQMWRLARRAYERLINQRGQQNA
jgi:hypothetical protein